MAPLGRQAPVPTPLLPPPGLTIMQQLQAERRQREEEYVRRQNNWPGFNDTNPPNTGLWGEPQTMLRICGMPHLSLLDC